MLEADGVTVNRSQLNSSSSKMQYSIGKANRFTKEKDEYFYFKSALGKISFMISPILKAKDLLRLGLAKRWNWGRFISRFPLPMLIASRASLNLLRRE